MTMEETLREIDRCRKLTALSPDEYPRNNRAGYEIAARAAKDALPKLEAQYVAALIGHSFTVAVCGTPERCKEFETLARAEALEILVDVRKLYEEIAIKVMPSMGKSGEWRPSQHSLAISYAEHKAVDLGFNEVVYDSRAPFSAQGCSGLDEAIEIVRQTIIARLGNDLGRVYVRSELTRAAVDAKVLPEQRLPVLILGAATQEEAGQLLAAWPSPSSVVELTDAPTVEQVLEAFDLATIAEESPGQSEISDEKAPADGGDGTQTAVVPKVRKIKKKNHTP